MNKERAVEEVLMGPFLNCPTCGGAGVQFTDGPAMTIHDESIEDYLICKECTGYGKVYRQFYLVAMSVLGLEPMPRSPVDLQGAVTTIAQQAMREATASFIGTPKCKPNWGDYWRKTTNEMLKRGIKVDQVLVDDLLKKRP